MSEILNVDDVAKKLKVSKRTVQREVEAGKLEAFKVGKSLRFRGEAVEEYMRKQRVQPGEKADDKTDDDDVEPAASAGSGASNWNPVTPDHGHRLH